MKDHKLTAVLLLSCPDRVGLVARLSHFIFERGGNILDLDEHVDLEQGVFSIRIAWDMKNFTIPAADLEQAISPLAREFNAEWRIDFLERRRKVAIFVSRYDHCLRELLWRYSKGEYDVDIPLIISNHSDLKSVADQYEIAFHHFSIDKSNKVEQEQHEIRLLLDHSIDTIVLARYMQILTPEFVATFPNQIINIHHSFLPAFMGGNPYKQAYERGVKIIGATSHYVTADLDEGPIIEQDIIRITHRDTISDLKRKGRDLERLVLARAMHHHFDQRVLVQGKRTVIFR